ncbi:MarR family transcriptional regulator [Anabaena sp. CCY 9402-a]|uniref:MarR family transcriptional regulator n=1 Tax=Anabaena sp. CCY 9402-a TaxID=3103867 RepID=UPI0039C5C70C
MITPDFEDSASPKTLTEIANLPDEQRQLMNWIIRQQQVTLAEIATHQDISHQEAQEQIQNLISQGFIQIVNDSDTTYYKPHFASPKKRNLSQNIWDKLET